MEAFIVAQLRSLAARMVALDERSSVLEGIVRESHHAVVQDSSSSRAEEHHSEPEEEDEGEDANEDESAEDEDEDEEEKQEEKAPALRIRASNKRQPSDADEEMDPVKERLTLRAFRNLKP